ncbi:MAG: nucleotidyltransferase family protein [Bacteroidales bacterium]|nr:nucleotidyltransferase family protein [Bacteroidales bacterium]MBK9358355.1 nucleotidyltransferase family protein [Bacteroidales bacterium]
MNSQLIEKHTIPAITPLRQALEKLNDVPDNLTLFVLNEAQQLVGTLTDGDVRRGLLTGLDLNDQTGRFMFRDFRFLKQHGFTLTQVKELRDKRIKMVPVLDSENRIVRLADLASSRSLLPLEAILMAGGRGERLRPLTDSIPKPLLKVGDKPILEHNLDHLSSFGIDHFHIAINYLGSMISDYFGDGSARNISISYLNEKRPLGTLGAASMIENFVFENILVMNADILTNIDLEDFFNDFEEQQALMSVASVPYKVNMPFAVLETKQNRVLSFREKPQYTYYTSGGLYLMKRSLINRIPPGSMYHATDLMDNILLNDEKLVQYPIHGVWMDIGRREDFDKAQEEIKHIRF